jgi:hypothetical protein
MLAYNTTDRRLTRLFNLKLLVSAADPSPNKPRQLGYKNPPRLRIPQFYILDSLASLLRLLPSKLSTPTMLPIFVSMAFAAAAYLSLSGLSDSESLVIHPWSNPRLHLSLCLLSALSARRVALVARRAFRSNRSSSLFDFAIRSPVPSLPAAPGASPLFMVMCYRLIISFTISEDDTGSRHCGRQYPSWHPPRCLGTDTDRGPPH